MPKIKDKERILAAARKKQFVIYKGASIRLSINFSKGTLQGRRDWQDIFKVLKSKITPSAELSFRIKEESKNR